MRPDLLAFAAACAFLGAALYVNIVEQPARLALDARSVIREWTSSNRRGFVMLAMLAVISSLSGYAQYVRTGDVRWLIGGTIILASWPYAYFVVTPVNILLYGSRMPLFSEAPYPGLASPACCWHAREADHARHTYPF